MARPIQPITPVDPIIVVDQHLTAVLRSPVLRDVRGTALVGRSASLALVASDQITTPIHNTLAGAGVALGDGSFTLTIPPRALWLRLAPHANRRIWLCCVVAGEEPVYVPHVVVWRAAEYPVPGAV